MNHSQLPIVFLTASTDSALFWSVDVALTQAQRQGACEVITATENLFSQLYERLENDQLKERIVVFHWIGTPQDSDFVEQLIKRLKNLPKIVCLVLEDINTSLSTSLAHQLPITILVEKANVEESFFSSHFYELLANGESIREAYNYASSRANNTPTAMFVKPSAEYKLNWSLQQSLIEEPEEISDKDEKTQRFRKILKYKAQFSAFSSTELLLSKRELALVEKYKHDLLPLSDIESQLWQRSISYLQQKQRKRRYLYRSIFFLIFFLFVFGMGFWAQHREHQRQLQSQQTQTAQQKADFLTYVSRNVKQQNATKAMHLAEHAVRTYPTANAQNALFSQFYDNNIFYSFRIKEVTQDTLIDRVISSDGYWTASTNGNIIFIHSIQDNVTQEIKSESVASLSFSEGIPYRLAVGFENGKVQVLDIKGKALLDTALHQSSVNKIKFLNADTELVSMADTTLIRWSIKGKVLDTVSVNGQEILDFCISPNQKQIITVFADSVVGVWEGKSVVASFDALSAKWLTEDYIFLKNNDSTSTIWNLQTSQIRAQFSDFRQIVAHDSLSYWFLGTDYSMQRQFYLSDSVEELAKDVAYISDYQGKKTALIYRDGTGELWFSDSTYAKILLEQMPLHKPEFSNDGEYLITQDQEHQTFWRANKRYHLFDSRIAAQEWLLEKSEQSFALDDLAVLYYSGNIFRLTDQKENVKAEWEAEQVVLHPSQNYVLIKTEHQLSLDEFYPSETASVYSSNILFTLKQEYDTVGFSPRGSFIWAITKQNRLHLIDLQGEIFFNKKIKPNSELVVSDSENLLALSLRITEQILKPYRIIHIYSDKEYDLDTRFERGGVNTFFFSPDENYLISASTGWTDFWDTRGRRIRTIRGGNPIFGQDMLLTSAPNHFFISTPEGNTVLNQEQKGLQEATLSEDKLSLILAFPNHTEVWMASRFEILNWVKSQQLYELSTSERKQLQLK